MRKRKQIIEPKKLVFFILFAFLFSFLGVLFLFPEKFVRSKEVASESKKGKKQKKKISSGYLEIEGVKVKKEKKKEEEEEEEEVSEYAFTPFSISAKLSSDGKSILVSWKVPVVSEIDYVLVRYEDIINTPKKAKDAIVLGIFPSEITEYRDVPDKLGEYYYAIFPRERDKKRIIIKLSPDRTYTTYPVVLRAVEKKKKVKKKPLKRVVRGTFLVVPTIRVKKIGRGEVLIEWDKVGDGYKYRVYRYLGAVFCDTNSLCYRDRERVFGEPKVISVEPGRNRVVDTGFEVPGRYYYLVTAWQKGELEKPPFNLSLSLLPSVVIMRGDVYECKEAVCGISARATKEGVLIKWVYDGKAKGFLVYMSFSPIRTIEDVDRAKIVGRVSGWLRMFLHYDKELTKKRYYYVALIDENGEESDKVYWGENVIAFPSAKKGGFLKVKLPETSLCDIPEGISIEKQIGKKGYEISWSYDKNKKATFSIYGLFYPIETYKDLSSAVIIARGIRRNRYYYDGSYRCFAIIPHYDGKVCKRVVFGENSDCYLKDIERLIKGEKFSGKEKKEVKQGYISNLSSLLGDNIVYNISFKKLSGSNIVLSWDFYSQSKVSDIVFKIFRSDRVIDTYKKAEFLGEVPFNVRTFIAPNARFGYWYLVLPFKEDRLLSKIMPYVNMQKYEKSFVEKEDFVIDDGKSFGVKGLRAIYLGEGKGVFLSWRFSNHQRNRFFKVYRFSSPVYSAKQIKVPIATTDKNFFLDRTGKPGNWYYVSLVVAGKEYKKIDFYNNINVAISYSGDEGFGVSSKIKKKEKNVWKMDINIRDMEDELNGILKRFYYAKRYKEAKRRILSFISEKNVKGKVRAKAKLFLGRCYYYLGEYKKALLFLKDREVRRYYRELSRVWILRVLDRLD